MHNIFYVDMEENGDKKALEERMSRAAKEDGDGLYVRFVWNDIISVKNNRDEAGEWLEEVSKGYSYYCGAIKYYSYPVLESSKKSILIKKLNDYKNKLMTLENKNHFADLKSKLFSCSKCESKINRNYIKYNKCPVCGQDLRSKTVLDTLTKYRTTIEETQKAIYQEETYLQEKARKKGQAKVKWLVRVEYHS